VIFDLPPVELAGHEQEICTDDLWMLGDPTLKRQLLDSSGKASSFYDSRADHDRWIADHAAWRERLNSELSEADRIRALDYTGLNDGERQHEKDLRPAKQRVDRILGNLRELYDEYHRGVR
jgi:hypothetical protein